MKSALLSWQLWALLSAVFAALTAIFAKVGVADVNSDFATLIRTVVILRARAPRRGHRPVAAAGDLGRTWLFLVLSGLATGASWLCYFRALKLGDAARVAPIDKLSVVFVAVFGVAFLGERLAHELGGGGADRCRRGARCLQIVGAPDDEPIVQATCKKPPFEQPPWLEGTAVIPRKDHARLSLPHHHARPQHGRRPRPLARHRHEGRATSASRSSPSSTPSRSSCPATSTSRTSASWSRARSRRPAASPRSSTPSRSTTASPWATTACSTRCPRAS